MIGEEKEEKSVDWESIIDEQLERSDKTVEDEAILFTPSLKHEGFDEDMDDGMVAVKDGEIFGKPSSTQYPTISVGKYIKLFKNGKLAEGTTIVTKDDHFSLEIEEKEMATKWRVEMDPHQLTVSIHVEPGVKIERFIKDSGPATHLFIETQEKKIIQNTLTYEEIISKLEELQVVHGFHHQEIMKALETSEPASFIIARGVEATDGRNGYLELISSLEYKQEGPKEREDGTVDFREIASIPTVCQGQVIGIVHSPIPGIPGKTVTNKPLPAKQTFPLVIHTGKGVLFIEGKDEGRIVATESGRPVLEKSGQLVKISIVQKMVYSGDVTISTGNVRFNGDIDILGNVEKSMEVEADGIITIAENVNMATVISKSSILLRKNVIGSTISSGKDNMFITELVSILDQIEQQVGKLILSIDQLRKVPALKLSDYKKSGLLPLLNLLLEKKFSVLKAYVKQFQEITVRGEKWISSEWNDMALKLRLCFLAAIPNKYHSFEEINMLLYDIGVLHDDFKVTSKAENFVELLYSLNSLLFCSGDITIFGQGCYNTKIHSGGTVKINGVLRGGEVYAREGMVVKEAGSISGAGTKLVVPQDQTIMMNLAREGTTIQIGKAIHKFEQDLTYFSAFCDENGRIGFNSTRKEQHIHV